MTQHTPSRSSKNSPSDTSDPCSIGEHLRIVRGEPTAEELAALTAIVTAAGTAPAPAATEAPRRGRWNDPAYTHRQLWPTGPGAWRAALH